jgi:tetratricopeptide (TPR) repeat protein
MAMHNLALALSHLGRYDEAMLYLQQALVVAPRDPLLGKLEFRTRVLRVRAKIGRVVGVMFRGRGKEHS